MKIISGLAPMAGFSDIPFRRLCSSLGADYTVTEMVSAAAVCFGSEKTFALSEIASDEAPCALQLFGHDPGMMSEAAERILDGNVTVNPSAAIEINMGCPVRKIVSSGDGSALMREPGLAAELVRRTKNVAERYGLPLWVKIRAGWDKNSVNAPSFAALMADSGADRITVHGRTRDMMYAPSSDNAVIGAVRRAVPENTEVFGNGDICSAADAVRMINETGCDGVLVGREALGNPWIFSEIASLNCDREYCPPTVLDRTRAAIGLTREIVGRLGERAGIRMARGRAAHFIKGIRGAAEVRGRLNSAETFDEFSAVLMWLAELNDSEEGHCYNS